MVLIKSDLFVDESVKPLDEDDMPLDTPPELSLLPFIATLQHMGPQWTR